MIAEIRKLARLLRYFPLFILTGIGAGLLGYTFRQSVAWACDYRHLRPNLLYLLPTAALLVTVLYRKILKKKKDGTKTVISAVRNNTSVVRAQIPLVFFASVLTHLFGGSAGREGAVLEMGGVLGDKMVSLLRPRNHKGLRHHKLRFLPREESFETQRRVAILCGMAGAFSALFVTPLAAVFFVLEVTDNRQILHRFVPVFFSSIIAFAVVCLLGWEPTRTPYYLPEPIPSAAFFRTCVLSACCGIVGRFFCISVKITPRVFRRYIKNDYLRAMAASSGVVLLTLLLRTDRFNGLGTESINTALLGKSCYFDFFWKTVLTALTLAAGLKGGEIIPAIFVGASFGAAFSPMIGFLPDLGAAVGVVAILAATAKTPLAAFLLGTELFGVDGTLFFALSSVIAFYISGRKGLYS